MDLETLHPFISVALLMGVGYCIAKVIYGIYVAIDQHLNGKS